MREREEGEERERERERGGRDHSMAANISCATLLSCEKSEPTWSPD